VVTGADAVAVDAAIAAWLMDQAGLIPRPGSDDGALSARDAVHLVPVRVDGKTVRGAKGVDGGQVHLLAALAGEQGVVAAQAEVGVNTNEIPMIIPLLDGLDLAGTVITADALHTQRATASYVHGRGADFALAVKDNQPGLFDALPWRDVPVSRATAGRGHGRIETRTIQVMDAPGDLPFPHVSQVYLIERHVTGLDTPQSDVAALGVTSLTAYRADPACLAALVRGQWAIESCTGCVTPCTARTNPGSAPGPDPGSWPRSGTSRSEPSTWPDATTPPKPPAGSAGTWTGPSRSSGRAHDLETAVVA
jgi:predicted transposase YbfD/YdcC